MNNGPGTMVTGLKLQASSLKIYTQQIQQASSTKLLKPQATSFKPQARRFKLQAASDEIHDPRSLIKFHGTRTTVLC